MRIFRTLALPVVAAIIIAAAMLPSPVSHAQSSQATMSVVPPSSSVVKSAKTVDVSINVANVQGLAGFQFVLVVDPKVLKPKGALKTGFLGQTGREVYCPDPTIEDAAIRYACVTLRDKPAAVNGSGTVATVSFNAVGKGTTDLTLKEVRLVRIDGTAIPSTSKDSRLSVTGGVFWTAMHIGLIAGGAVIVVLLLIAAGIVLARQRMPRRATPESGADVGV